jgi:WD40 repeat protein
MERFFSNVIVSQSIFRANGHDLLVVPKTGPMQAIDLRSGTNLVNLPENDDEGHIPLAYSPDGRWLATKLITLAQGGEVVVQNLRDSSSFSLHGHKPHVVAGAFSSDGKMLATGSWDKTVRIWDTTRRKPLHVLRGHKEQVRTVAFSPDGLTLASASPDGIIHFWDISLGREILTLDTGSDGLAALTFTPDGLELKAAFDDGTIRSWFASTKSDIDRLVSEAR